MTNYSILLIYFLQRNDIFSWPRFFNNYPNHTKGGQQCRGTLTQEYSKKKAVNILACAQFFTALQYSMVLKIAAMFPGKLR